MFYEFSKSIGFGKKISGFFLAAPSNFTSRNCPHGPPRRTGDIGASAPTRVVAPLPLVTFLEKMDWAAPLPQDPDTHEELGNPENTG
jgi:hypothetical protein